MNNFKMATLKKDTFTFSGGRSIDLPQGVVTITRRLELTDYYSRLILFSDPATTGDKKGDKVTNIYALTKEEALELADYMIRRFIDFKDNIRELGIDNPDIFLRKKD